MRRHVIVTGIILLAIGFVLVPRILRLGASPPWEPRACAIPLRYETLSFTGARLLYHWTVDALVDERMDLYDDTTPLACGEGEEASLAQVVGSVPVVMVSGVVPSSAVLAGVASGLQAYEGKSVGYADFIPILFEHWREYDCTLVLRKRDPAFGLSAASTVMGSTLTPLRSLLALGTGDRVIERERQSAKLVLQNLLSLLSSSEQLLPAHAAIQCLVRASLDVRNALDLYTDASACIPARLWNPTTSLRAPP